MDRDLPASLLREVPRALGVEAGFDGDFLVVRRVKDGPLVYKLWLRRGREEIVRAATIRTLCRHILDIPTDSFAREVAAAETRRRKG